MYQNGIPFGGMSLPLLVDHEVEGSAKVGLNVSSVDFESFNCCKNSLYSLISLGCE
jgi:hypothetical protein